MPISLRCIVQSILDYFDIQYPLKVVDHILRKASECNIQLPWFQIFLSSSNFYDTVSKSARMYHLASLVFKCSKQFPTFKPPFQKVSECINQLPCFQNFLSSFNFLKVVSDSARMHQFASLLLNFSQQFQLQEHRFKQRQYAPYIVLDFNIFSGVPTSFLFYNSVIMHLLVSLVSKLSQQYFIKYQQSIVK